MMGDGFGRVVADAAACGLSVLVLVVFLVGVGSVLLYQHCPVRVKVERAR